MSKNLNSYLRLLQMMSLVIASVIICNAKEPTSVQKIGLAGKVKNYTVYCIQETNTGKEIKIKTEEYEFDEKGNMTLHRVYDAQGEIVKTQKSDIDKRGKIIQEKTTDNNGKESKKENTYNKKGLLLKTTTKDEKGQTVAVDSIIYKKKRKIGKIHWQTNPPVKVVCSYDKRGYITERTIENDKMMLKDIYNYNKQHDIELWSKYETLNLSSDSVKTDTTLTHWIYDAQNHLKMKEVSIGGYIKEFYLYTCDIKGNKTKIYHYVIDDRLANQYKLKSNELFTQLPIHDIELDKLLKESQHFTYDQNGNKTSEYTYEQKLVKAIKYEITYYE